MKGCAENPFPELRRAAGGEEGGNTIDGLSCKKYN